MGTGRRRQAPQAAHGVGERSGGRRAACALEGSRKRFRCAIGRGTLIARVVINGTDASLAQHDGGTNENSEASYSADPLARLVREAVRRIAGELLRKGAPPYDAHAKLLATSTHVFPIHHR